MRCAQLVREGQALLVDVDVFWPHQQASARAPMMGTGMPGIAYMDAINTPAIRSRNS